MRDSVRLLGSALEQHFDKSVEHVRFHKGELHDKIASAEGMGKEAFQELHDKIASAEGMGK